MLRRLGIRAKVMAVLAVPMIVLLAAGGYISWNALSELRYAQAADSVITVPPLSERIRSACMLDETGVYACSTVMTLSAAWA